MRFSNVCPRETTMELKVTYENVKALKPYKNNPRTHNAKQISKITDSIENFNFLNPIIINKDRIIIAGHGRWLAAQKIGMDKVPVVRIEHLSDEEMKAYVIADNKLAELAGWDQDILAIEFQYILEADLNFDAEITGFETAEIDFLIDSQNNEDIDITDNIIEPDKSKPATVKYGDLYILGKHKLYCGDSLELDSYQRLIGKNKAQMCFTDPPYNVRIQGHVSGKGKIKHREFEHASGEMSKNQFTDFLSTMLSNTSQHLMNGSMVFVCMDWRHTFELDSAIKRTGYEHKNTCVWVKNNGGMGSLYRSKHEFVYVLKNGKEPHINNIELGKHGRYRTNVWEYAGVNTFRKDRLKELAMHPTVKPVALVIDAIKDCSKRKGIILDPFAGSGTTLIAAEKTGRYARLIEIDPHYCDVIIERWQNLTGETAELVQGVK